MKNPIRLTAALLAFTLSTLAQEPNPFVKSATPASPTEASGDSFIDLVEHILVPANQLDAWLENHPLTDDASGLRATAQQWIADGSARLDQTAISTCTAGREFVNNSIWEQTYATEYEPPVPGEWPFPGHSSIMSLGYFVRGGGGMEDGSMLLRAKMEFSGMMMPHHPWDKLAERTRQPDDVFIPRFRTITAERVIQDPAGIRSMIDPFDEPDPFAEAAPEPAGARDLRFIPNRTYLASRTDDELPEPIVSKSADSEAKPTPLAPDRMARLIFFRGTLLDAPATPSPAPTEINQLSVRIIRVKQQVFSNWIRTNDLAKIPDLAWTAAKGWLKQGAAETTTYLTGPHHAGSICVAEDRQEVTYPTEWEPGKRAPASDGKPSQEEFSLATAFDTRNVGTTLKAEVVSDPKGSILKFDLKRVVDGGKSVHHRIFRDGEWQPDVTFPIFSSNAWELELRAKQAVWMLIGSGSDIDAKGKLDSESAVLVFIRLD